MADLFQYTTADTLVAPSSPTIQVKPNMQAANTFKSLQGLLQTGLQVATQEVKNEQVVLNEAMQLRRMELAEIEATKKAEVDAQKAQTKELELQAQLTAQNELSGAETLYNARISSLAEDDYEGYALATSDYNASLSEIQNVLPDSVKKSMFSSFDSRKQEATKNFLEFAKKHGIDTYMDQMSFAAPAFIQASQEEKKELFNNWQSGANRRGISAKQFGDDFVGIIGSHLTVSLDQGNIVENRDFTSLAKAQQTLKDLQSLDPRAKASLETQQNKIDAIEKELRSAVRADVDDARITNSRQTFEQLLEYGVQNGVYNPAQAELERRNFVKTNFNESKNNEMFAKFNVGRANGNVQVDTMPEGQRKYAKGMVTDMLRNMLRSGDLEPSKLQFHATANPKIFRSEFKTAFNQLADVAMSTAQAALAEKDPEKQGQMWNQYLQQTQRLDALASVSNYQMGTEELISRSIVKAVAMSGKEISIAKIRENMEQRGGEILIHGENSYVKDIKDADSDIPFDQRNEAHRVFSALVASGMEQSVASEVVTNSFSFTEIGDTGVMASGTVNQILNQAGVGADSLDKFVDVLLNDGTLAGLKEETFSEEVRENLQAVLSGTEPKVHTFKGHLLFENAEGTSTMIRFGREEANAMAEAMNSAYRATLKPSVGFSRITDDAVTTVSPIWSREIDGFSNIAELIADGAEVVADSLVPSWEAVTDVVSGSATSLNLWIDDLYNEDVTLAQAQENIQKREDALFDAYVKQIEKARGESMEGFRESWEQTKANWNATVQNAGELTEGAGQYAFEFMPSAARALTDLLISKAEGAEADQPTGEYFQQGTVSILGGEGFNQDKFMSYIAERAESQHGFDKKTQTYTPALTSDASEKGKPNSEKSSDIGYGHKIKDAEWESGMIHGHKFWEDGKAVPLSETQVLDIMQKDMAENLSGVLPNWNKKIAGKYEDRDFGDLHPQAQAVLNSLAYNVGSTSAKDWNEVFNNDGLFYPVMVPSEIQKFATDLRRQDAGKNTAGMDNRVMKELVAAGLVYDEYTFEQVKESLPLMNEYPSFESTLK